MIFFTIGDAVQSKKLPKEISAKFNSRRWRIRFVNRLAKGTFGDCQDSKKASERIIRVKRAQKEEDLLDTILHEMLHAILPQLTEDIIYDAANDLSRTLIKLGYKLEKE